jgi:heme-degrading monooxygenase HmoA
MFARIGVWQGNAEELERWITRSTQEVKPAVQAQPGAKGAYWLLDRQSRKALTITLWESEAAMRKSDERAAAIQAGTSAASGARFTTERYEIIDQFHAV